MKKPEHMWYWHEAVTSVARHMPGVPIVVIDDHSDPELCAATQPAEVLAGRLVGDFSVVCSRLDPGVGELLPYLYLSGTRRFRCALVLHDSMFLQAPPRIDRLVAPGFRILWHFDGMPRYLHEGHGDTMALLDAAVDPERLPRIKRLYARNLAWVGCFGTAMVITQEALDLLNGCGAGGKLFERLAPLIKSRDQRSALERILPLLLADLAYCGASGPNVECADGCGRAADFHGLWGNIIDHPGAFRVSFRDHAARPAELSGLDAVKVWSTR